MTFSPAVIDRLIRETFVASVDYRPQLASTNDRALLAALRDDYPLPWLVVTDRQTAGRGRGANRWESSDGALTFSLLLEASVWGLKPANFTQLSLAAGLAVCEAVDPWLPPGSVGLKWPNDVQIAGRKLAGMLAETPAERPDRVVLGVGLNVNNTLTDAPADVQARATTLSQAAGQSLDLIAVLVQLLVHLEQKLRWIQAAPDVLLRHWRARCVLSGRRVGVELPNRCLVGQCTGIDPDGALMLQTPTGVERLLAGVVAKID